ncbi:hypothetical protein Trydic_g17457 [Trypoxylus dichotomus]
MRNMLIGQIREMTKRVGNYYDTKCKKSKTDDHVVGDLWNDDLDEHLVLATQVCEQSGSANLQDNNVSILQNYSFFEQHNKNGYTSTQKESFNGNMISSTFVQPCSSYRISNNFHGNYGSNNIGELKEEIRIWKEKCESKDGEVTILRTQLKETKHNLELEHQRKEKEWLEKMNVCSKEIASIKSHLDFKNLEVMNLKNKLSEVSKVYASDPLLGVKHGENETTVSKRCRLEAIADERCIFTDAQVSLLFSSERSENFIVRLKSNINYDILMQQNDQELLAKYKNITESKHFKLSSILSSVSTIKRNDNSSYHIDQILTVAKNALTYLYDYLSIQERFIQRTDNQGDVIESEEKRSDSNLSILDSLPWNEKEIGIKARQIVAVIGEILPYNHYLLKQLLGDIVTNRNEQYKGNNDYLDHIKMTIKLINATGSIEITQGFLCAVTALLHRISQTNMFRQNYLFALDVSRELLSAKPSRLILKQLLLFLRQASICPDFVQELCKGPPQKDQCYIDLFLTVYTSRIINANSIDINIGLYGLQLITNVLNCNPLWFHYEEKQSCNCICKINTLCVGIIHELVKSYRKAKLLHLNDLKPYTIIFKNSIKLLHIINFKYFDTINKYFVDSQYKFIVNYLSSLEDAFVGNKFEKEALNEINIQDDICKINSSDFDNIPIWNC